MLDKMSFQLTLYETRVFHDRLVERDIILNPDNDVS